MIKNSKIKRNLILILKKLLIQLIFMKMKICMNYLAIKISSIQTIFQHLILIINLIN